MSYEYDQYLMNHRSGVRKAFYWIKENLHYCIREEEMDEIEHLVLNHDASKDEPDEYQAYDAYFYGNNRSYEVVKEFNKAWLLHIHRNPHHWQYWVLIPDDSSDREKEILIDMPYKYIIEMICDWWSFSWNSGNLHEIFDWYGSHNEHIKLSPRTGRFVEDILAEIEDVLEEQGNDDN